MRWKATATAKLRAEREAKGETLELGEIRGMDQEEILSYFYGQVVFDHTAEGLGAAVRSRRVPRREAAGADHRRRDRRGGGRCGRQADAAPGAAHRREDQGGAGRPHRSARPLRGRGPGERGDRRDLRRGRRGTDRAEARRAGGRRRHRAADAGGRSVDRAVDPQHAGGGQELQPRRRADRHLPRHAPGRAADAGDRRGAVPRPVLRWRPLRPVGGRPGEDEHAARLRGRGGFDARAAQGGPAAHGEDPAAS